MDNKTNISKLSFLEVLEYEIHDTLDEHRSYRNEVFEYLNLVEYEPIKPSSLFSEILEKTDNYGVKPYSKESFLIARSSIEFEPIYDPIAEDIENEFFSINEIAREMFDKAVDNEEDLGRAIRKAEDLFRHTIKILETKFQESKNEYTYSIVKLFYSDDIIRSIQLVLIKK